MTIFVQRAIVSVIRVLACGGVFGCSTLQVAPNTLDADTEAIKSVREAAVQAQVDGDADALAALAVEDIVYIPADEPTMVGRELFREYLARRFAGADFELKLTHEEVIVAGDWAIHRSTIKGTRTLKANGESVPWHVKAIDILRRQSDGSWKHARIIFNRH